MQTIIYCLALARVLGGKNPAWFLLSLISILCKKKVLGRKARRVNLYIADNRYHFFLRDAADIAALHEVFVDKEYNFDSQPPKSIIDIGGHIGSASLFFITKYPDASITVYEPEPDTFEVLKLNMSSFKTITCVNAAVSGKAGIIDFYSSKSSIGSSIHERKDSKKIQVESYTLDSILTDQVEMIKFDIEGAEYAMFSSSKRVNLPKILIGELHYDLMGADLDTFLKLFTGYSETVKPISASRSILLLQRI